MSTALVEILRRLADRHDLTAEESRLAVASILAGLESEASISAFLTALRVKGETADELAGAVEAVLAVIIPVELGVSPRRLLDTCGTGGDGANTLNVSTAAALIVAACGVSVAKHGNRSASGNSGSAEVLVALGVAIEVDESILARSLCELGITFLLAPRFHPGLRFAGPVRRQLPFRTLFNLVGPLANPVRPAYQLVGVSGEREARLVADALARLGDIERAAVVTGHGNLDEVALDGPTNVFVVEPGTVRQHYWHPEDFGLGPVSTSDLHVSGPADSAARITHLLVGEPGPARDVVLANAAAALWVRGETDLRVGVARASEAVDSGEALRLLARWRELTACQLAPEPGGVGPTSVGPNQK